MVSLSGTALNISGIRSVTIKVLVILLLRSLLGVCLAIYCIPFGDNNGRNNAGCPMQRPWGQIVCMSPRTCAYAQRRVALHTSLGGNDIPHKGDMTPYTTAQSSYIHVVLGTKLHNFSSSSHTLP